MLHGTVSPFPAQKHQWQIGHRAIHDDFTEVEVEVSDPVELFDAVMQLVKTPLPMHAMQ